MSGSTTTTASAQPNTTADTPKKVDLGLLEEDDEFEEFPAEEWTGKCDAEEANVWEDNWDDDNVEDDFSDQLRKELQKVGYQNQQDVKM